MFGRAGASAIGFRPGIIAREPPELLRHSLRIPQRLRAAWKAAVGELRGRPPGLSEVRMTTLPSGVRVVSEDMPFLPPGTAVVGVWIDAAARHDPIGLLGSAHFLEHGNFLGTGSLSADDVAERLDRLGGGKNALTGIDTTNYFVSVTGDGLGHAVALLGDMVLRSRLAEAEINAERRTILDEADKICGGKARGFSIGTWQKIYPEAPLPVVGSADQINAITAKALREFRDRHITADRIAVVAAGNLDHQRLQDLTARHFGGVNPPPGQVSAQRRQPQRGIPVLRAGDWRESDLDAKQISIDLIFPGFPLTHPQRRAAVVLEFILGGGFTSGLYRAMRRKKQISYDYRCGHVSYGDYGYFSVGGFVDPRHGDVFIETIGGQLCDVVAGFGDTALEQAKNSILSNLNFGRFSPYSRYLALGSTTLASGRPVAVEQVETVVRAITVQEVQAAAAEMFGQRPALAAYGPVAGLVDYDRAIASLPLAPAV